MTFRKKRLLLEQNNLRTTHGKRHVITGGQKRVCSRTDAITIEVPRALGGGRRQSCAVMLERPRVGEECGREAPGLSYIVVWQPSSTARPAVSRRLCNLASCFPGVPRRCVIAAAAGGRLTGRVNDIPHAWAESQHSWVLPG